VRQPLETPGLRHAPMMIALHWITVLLVMMLWTIGQTVDWVPEGPLRVDYRSVHIVLGVTLGLVLVIRLTWRATRDGLLPPLDTGLLLIVARMTHWALYGLMIVTVTLGVSNAWVRGDSIFNVFAIPQLISRNDALVHLIGGWHALGANTLLIVAGLHATAALFHHCVLRDRTLSRMLPWARR
jgi:cytochrome b561